VMCWYLETSSQKTLHHNSKWPLRPVCAKVVVNGKTGWWKVWTLCS